MISNQDVLFRENRKLSVNPQPMPKTLKRPRAGRNGLPPIHPGEILKEELEERTLTASALARALGVPVTRITEILNQRRGVSADSALRLAKYFGGDARFWLNLQQSYELKVAEAEIGATALKRIVPAAA
ncbi:MAG: HigA family addiction module antitoxin [Rhodospirillaceae bacterium]|nr:HigA family addiction module antitoxin [Rhodospirillaceae bacterium]